MAEVDWAIGWEPLVKVIPGVTSTWISISLEPQAGGAATAARVVYEPTSLGEAGDEAVERFTEEAFDGFMRAWEAELNHFLATGRRLDEEAPEEG